jgi:hypothetical protein
MNGADEVDERIATNIDAAAEQLTDRGLRDV